MENRVSAIEKDTTKLEKQITKDREEHVRLKCQIDAHVARHDLKKRRKKATMSSEQVAAAAEHALLMVSFNQKTRRLVEKEDKLAALVATSGSTAETVVKPDRVRKT